VGVTQVRITRIEVGASTPSEELLDRILAELAVTPEEATRLRTVWVMGAIGDPDGTRQMPGYALNLIRLERVAAEVLCWHELRIPRPVCWTRRTTASSTWSTSPAAAT
jgi:hypothetical protein